MQNYTLSIYWLGHEHDGDCLMEEGEDACQKQFSQHREDTAGPDTKMYKGAHKASKREYMMASPGRSRQEETGLSQMSLA